ncbi:MAG: hypothetical protein LBO21_00395 [Synergistaceae bacterium]|jgi:predicted transposase/invertase (TIGR01784 family)|nr:hypothetical protein [Synergistaceae bacterium]
MTKTEEIRMTVGRLKQLSEDERTRMICEARELYLMDEAARREVAVAEGKTQGKFEVARSMLGDGLPVETIMKYTGLDKNSIHSLR